MKWINKVIVAIVVTFTIGAGVVLAILNPQMVTINLWGWVTIERTAAVWLLIMLALGIVIGVGLSSILIIKLQSQLYVSKRRLATQLNTTTKSDEIKK